MSLSSSYGEERSPPFARPEGPVELKWKTASMSDPCSYCTYDIPRAEDRCPHCARPSRFPNVLDAKDERQALDLRHRDAICNAKARGCDDRLRDFEAAAAGSHAVIARPIDAVERLATSDKQVYATY